jgi:hypothetical protein
MILEEALRALAPFAGPDGFDVERATRRLASDESRTAPLRALLDGVEAGRVTASAWRSATTSEGPRDFAVAFGKLWDALVRAGLVESADGFPSDWSQETLRLWAYTDGWTITSEDEDLALMSEEYVPGLLEIAREGACPKRDYILCVIRHWARDRASSAAGRNAFSERREGFSDVVARIARHASPAREAGDPALADYLSRLGSYGLPGPVEREGAHQRGLDLTACAEPRPEEVTVERDGPLWRVELPGAPGTLRIAVSDGRIW